nr:hypothetical protein [Tanacetum cinerariifolium]
MTLAVKAILLGADNPPPMLEKDMYDSWKSRMELYMMNRQHGRMILESVQNGLFIWPTIEEDGVTRPRIYSELPPAEAIQEVLMIDWLRIIETEKVIHNVETDIVKLMVEIESFGMISDDFEKETMSFDELQLKQADLSCVHALIELHLHEFCVVPSEHEADRY